VSVQRLKVKWFKKDLFVGMWVYYGVVKNCVEMLMKQRNVLRVLFI
jgi:hypothetical protein